MVRLVLGRGAAGVARRRLMRRCWGAPCAAVVVVPVATPTPVGRQYIDCNPGIATFVSTASATTSRDAHVIESRQECKIKFWSLSECTERAALTTRYLKRLILKSLILGSDLRFWLCRRATKIVLVLEADVTGMD